MKRKGHKDSERSYELRRKRNKRIVALYNRLSNITENGVQKYSHAFIMNKLEEHFYLVERTLLEIISKHDSSEPEVMLPTQGNLFN